MSTVKKGKRAPARRKYITDPAEKLKAGKPWTLHFEIDPDVGHHLIKEKANSNGAEFGRIINAHLREHYANPESTTKRKLRKSA